MKKQFYRVAHIETGQGVWYDIYGNFLGLIHDKFNFCKNNNLLMPFDKDLVGYLSATDTLEDLFNWFPMDDIKKLQQFGWFITVYESDNAKVYKNHFAISKESSIVINRIKLF